MKFVIVILACVALTHSAPTTKRPDPGAYEFSYSTDESAKSEIGDADGSVRGAYTYIDDIGAVHHVKYVAGPEIGFMVLEDKVDLSTAKLSKEFPRAHEIKLVNGLTPEVAAAKAAHLSTYKAIRAFLPELEMEEEEVKIHHLRHEVPATVHRTTVPESVHSMNPPPIISKKYFIKKDEPLVEEEALIDGFTPEVAAAKEAHSAFQTALRTLLPELKEEGEIIVPVHHVHHVHHQGHIEAAPPKSTTTQVRVITKPDGHIIEHLKPTHTHETRFIEVRPEEHLEAGDIMLIDGYTPEVHAAREAHLAQVAAIKALLPEVEENF